MKTKIEKTCSSIKRGVGENFKSETAIEKIASISRKKNLDRDDGRGLILKNGKAVIKILTFTNSTPQFVFTITNLDFSLAFLSPYPNPTLTHDTIALFTQYNKLLILTLQIGYNLHPLKSQRNPYKPIKAVAR